MCCDRGGGGGGDLAFAERSITRAFQEPWPPTRVIRVQLLLQLNIITAGRDGGLKIHTILLYTLR